MQDHIKSKYNYLFFSQGHCVILGCSPTCFYNIYIDKLANMIDQSPLAQPTTE